MGHSRANVNSPTTRTQGYHLKPFPMGHLLLPFAFVCHFITWYEARSLGATIARSWECPMPMDTTIKVLWRRNGCDGSFSQPTQYGVYLFVLELCFSFHDGLQVFKSNTFKTISKETNEMNKKPAQRRKSNRSRRRKLPVGRFHAFVN